MAGRALPGTANVRSTGRQKLMEICPRRRGVSFELAELWKYRRLLCVFAWRDVKVRYKQTVLGAVWAILQPFLTMLIFTLVFARLARVSSEGIPYPIFVFCGLLPWQYFAHGLVRSCNILVEERYLLTKIYIPRLVLPVSIALSGLLDFAVAFAVLLGMMFYYGVRPTWAVLMVPPLLLLAVPTVLSVGLFLSALNVRYRDVECAIPFFSQLWFFVTPVAYPSTLIPGPWRTVYDLNPMAVVVEEFRWALVNSKGLSVSVIIASTAGVMVLMLFGLMYFQLKEKTFADVV